MVNNSLGALGTSEILVDNIIKVGNKTFTGNINDYRYIMFITRRIDGSGSVIRGVTVVPIQFVLINEAFFTVDSIATSDYYCGAKYIGNNTFSITEYKNAANSRTFYIYGIKWTTANKIII